MLPRSRHANRSFWNLLGTASKVGAGCHVAFGLLFLALGMPGMLLANVGSVGLYIIVLALLRARRNQAAVSLLLFEVAMHAALAVPLVGWGSGFQYYLLLLPPVIFASHGRGKLLLGGGALALFLALDMGTHGAAPHYATSERVLSALRWFNAAAVFGLLGYLSHVYLAAVRGAESRLQNLASTDPLTGALNRRSLLDAFDTPAVSGQARLSVVMGDIDRFKAINDTHGHQGGDHALVGVCAAISGAVRPGDLVARWGGEEFVVLLAGADEAAALVVAERIRAAVQALRIEHEGQPVPLQMTLGVAGRLEGESLEACIDRADDALYRGKHAGRNRVVGASPLCPLPPAARVARAQAAEPA